MLILPIQLEYSQIYHPAPIPPNIPNVLPVHKRIFERKTVNIFCYVLPLRFKTFTKKDGDGKQKNIPWEPLSEITEFPFKDMWNKV